MKSIQMSLIIWIFSILTSCGLSILPPEIKGISGSKEGQTDHKEVFCVLKKDTSIPNAISGELIIDKSFIELDLGLTLAVWNSDANLIASWGIQGREKNGKIHYYFLLQSELLESAKFSIFTKNEGMMDLRLSTVSIQKN